MIDIPMISEENVSELRLTYINDIDEQVSAIHNAFAFMEFDPSGYILEANDSYLGLIGYELDDLRGKHHSIFLDHLYSSSKEHKDFWKSLANGEPHSGRFFRYRKDGSKVWLQASYTPSTNEDGIVDKIIKLAIEIKKPVADIENQKLNFSNGVHATVF
ncbi:MAG: PAS domain-containing protein [Bacteroidota bacterium]